jgi:hypothetical protein
MNMPRASNYNMCLLRRCCPVVTPPGFYTTPASGTTVCGPGEFRAEWSPNTAATSCSKCGDGISAAKLEQITYRASDGSALIQDVSTNADACCEWLEH